MDEGLIEATKKQAYLNIANSTNFVVLTCETETGEVRSNMMINAAPILAIMIAILQKNLLDALSAQDGEIHASHN